MPISIIDDDVFGLFAGQSGQCVRHLILGDDDQVTDSKIVAENVLHFVTVSGNTAHGYVIVTPDQLLVGIAGYSGQIDVGAKLADDLRRAKITFTDINSVHVIPMGGGSLRISLVANRTTLCFSVEDGGGVSRIYAPRANSTIELFHSGPSGDIMVCDSLLHLRGEHEENWKLVPGNKRLGLQPGLPGIAARIQQIIQTRDRFIILADDNQVYYGAMNWDYVTKIELGEHCANVVKIFTNTFWAYLVCENNCVWKFDPQLWYEPQSNTKIDAPVMTNVSINSVKQYYCFNFVTDDCGNCGLFIDNLCECVIKPIDTVERLVDITVAIVFGDGKQYPIPVSISADGGVFLLYEAQEEGNEQIIFQPQQITYFDDNPLFVPGQSAQIKSARFTSN